MLLGMFCVGAAYTVIVRSTSGYALAIDERRVGCEQATEPEEFSLSQLFFFFVSIMFVLRKQRGHAWEAGYAWKSIDLCGDRWKDRTRQMERGHRCFSY